MIAKLKGRVDNVGRGHAVIDVGGVGYLVFASGRTLGRLAAGALIELLIETHVREDHIHLYGFLDAAERDWFKLLTTVQGVGVKVAMSLLTTLPPDELMRAIVAGDKGAVGRAPGVGPKLAARILGELKDKVGSMALATVPGAPGDADIGAALTAGGAIGDAASALVNLGYNPSQALGAVSRAADRLGPDATLEALIRGGLGELAPVDVRAPSVAGSA
ncbi:MAG: Holliday junction branch migration protein RuvA [Rhodospirillales bacterium]|nr:Holliday junction branch migration protein RuvA [Rhodospirillales bacterium]